MSIESIYGGTYMTAATVKSDALEGRVLTIGNSRTETFREDQRKVVLTFTDVKKELPLNKTNATMLAASFSDDEGAWIGKKITLSLAKKMYKGELVDSIVAMPKEETSQ